MFKREQQNLAGVIGMVRTQRMQLKWLTITAAEALVVELLLSPFAARLLPFGWYSTCRCGRPTGRSSIWPGSLPREKSSAERMRKRFRFRAGFSLMKALVDCLIVHSRLAFLFVTVFCGTCFGASFDCKRDRLSVVERAICEDSALPQQDTQLTDIYEVAQASTPLDARTQLASSQ